MWLTALSVPSTTRRSLAFFVMFLIAILALAGHSSPRLRTTLAPVAVNIGLFPHPFQAQDPTWSQKSPVASPPPRYAHAMAYDAARSQVVLFGGFGGAVLDDAWLWNGETWQSVSLPIGSNNPPARYYSAMAYDAARGQIVLFGGFTGSTFLNDTWVWDGTTWTQKFPAAHPVGRQKHSMAYDAARGKIVLFGGDSTFLLPAETWLWDGESWTQVFPAMSPSSRADFAMTYDAARGRVVLFGGVENASPGVPVLNDTWLWDGSNWTQAFPSNSPEKRCCHSIGYDDARSQVLLFGGNTGVAVLDDTWVWDGTTWTQKFPPTSPSARFNHAMTYDAGRSEVVLFGGCCSYSDTWIWGIPGTPNSPPAISGVTISRQQGVAVINSIIAAVSDAQDQAGSLTVTATSVPVGISVTNISNTNGTITADVAAACTAIVGNNTVQLTVTDNGGLTATANLIVSVTPNPPPTITCPADIISLTTKPDDGNVVVNYPEPTATDSCPGVAIVCTPASGSTFPKGTTAVSCIATNANAATAACTFTVTVVPCPTSSCASEPIRLRKMWSDGEYWKPETYLKHNPSGQNFAADFYFSKTTSGLLRNRTDLYRNTEGGVQGRTILAAHDGRVYLYLLDRGDATGNFDRIDADRVIRGIDPVKKHSFSFDTADRLRQIDVELVIDASTYRTLYAHLTISDGYFSQLVLQRMRNAISDFLNIGGRQAIAIDTGQTVSTGEPIGGIDKWGEAGDYHLHFNVFKGPNFPVITLPYGARLGQPADLSDPNQVILENQRIIDLSLEADVIVFGKKRFQYPAMPRRRFASNEHVIVKSLWDNQADVPIFDTAGGRQIGTIKDSSLGYVVIGPTRAKAPDGKFHVWWKVQFQSITQPSWIFAEYIDRFP